MEQSASLTLPPTGVHQMHPQYPYALQQHAGLHSSHGQMQQVQSQQDVGILPFRATAKDQTMMRLPMQPTQYYQTMPTLLVQSPGSRVGMYSNQPGPLQGQASARLPSAANQNGRTSYQVEVPRNVQSGLKPQEQQKQQLLPTPPAVPLWQVLPPAQRVLSMQFHHQQWQQMQQQQVQQQQMQQLQRQQPVDVPQPSPGLLQRMQSAQSVPVSQPEQSSHDAREGTETEGEQQSSRSQQKAPARRQQPTTAPEGDVEDLLQHLKEISSRLGGAQGNHNSSAKSDRTTVSASAGEEEGIGHNLPRRQRKPSVLLKTPDFDFSNGETYPRAQQVWYRANGPDTPMPAAANKQQQQAVGLGGYPAPVPVAPVPRARARTSGAGGAAKRPKLGGVPTSVSAEAPDAVPAGVQLERMGSGTDDRSPHSVRLDEIFSRLGDASGVQSETRIRNEDFVEARAELGASRVHWQGTNLQVYQLRSKYSTELMTARRSDAQRAAHPLSPELQKSADEFNTALSSLHSHPVVLEEFKTALQRILDSRFVVLEGFFLTVRQLRYGMATAERAATAARGAGAYVIVNHAERAQWTSRLGGRDSTERLLLKNATQIELAVRQQWLGAVEPWTVTPLPASMESLLQAMLHTRYGPFNQLLTAITRAAAEDSPALMQAPQQLAAAALASALRVCLGHGQLQPEVPLAPALYSSDTDKLDRVAPCRQVLKRALGDGASFCPGVAGSAVVTEEADRTYDVTGYRGPLQLDVIDTLPARALAPMLLMPLGAEDGALGPMAEEGGWVTVCPGVNSENLIISGVMTCTPKHVEDVLLGSVNIMVAGDCKLWEVIIDGEKYSDRIMSSDTATGQAHKLLIKQEFNTFSGEGIPVASIVQQAGTTVVTLPGHSWHHTTSSGVNMAIALNWGQPPDSVRRFCEAVRRKRIGGRWADSARRIDRAHQWGILFKEAGLPEEAKLVTRGKHKPKVNGGGGPVPAAAAAQESDAPQDTAEDGAAAAMEVDVPAAAPAAKAAAAPAAAATDKAPASDKSASKRKEAPAASMADKVVSAKAAGTGKVLVPSATANAGTKAPSRAAAVGEGKPAKAASPAGDSATVAATTKRKAPAARPASASPPAPAGGTKKKASVPATAATAGASAKPPLPAPGAKAGVTAAKSLKKATALVNGKSAAPSPAAAGASSKPAGPAKRTTETAKRVSSSAATDGQLQVRADGGTRKAPVKAKRTRARDEQAAAAAGDAAPAAADVPPVAADGDAAPAAADVPPAKAVVASQAEAAGAQPADAADVSQTVPSDAAAVTAPVPAGAEPPGDAATTQAEPMPAAEAEPSVASLVPEAVADDTAAAPQGTEAASDKPARGASPAPASDQQTSGLKRARITRSASRERSAHDSGATVTVAAGNEEERRAKRARGSSGGAEPAAAEHAGDVTSPEPAVESPDGARRSSDGGCKPSRRGAGDRELWNLLQGGSVVDSTRLRSPPSAGAGGRKASKSSAKAVSSSARKK